jgi:uncharacterized protein with GYD domain
MAFYLFTANYSRDAMQAMVKNPSDREAAARKIMEAAGGKLHHMFMAFGPTDVIALCEFPDDIGMAAVSLAVGSAGGVTNAATTKLLTPAEFSEAMRKANAIASSYTPPQG